MLRKICSMEKSVQSWHRCLFFCHHLITLSALHQHVGRNHQADLLRRLQINTKLELRRLLDWKVGWLGPFKDLIDISRSAPIQVGSVRPRGNLGFAYARKKNRPAAMEQYNVLVTADAGLAARLKAEIDKI